MRLLTCFPSYFTLELEVGGLTRPRTQKDFCSQYTWFHQGQTPEIESGLLLMEVIIYDKPARLRRKDHNLHQLFPKPRHLWLGNSFPE